MKFWSYKQITRGAFGWILCGLMATISIGAASAQTVTIENGGETGSSGTNWSISGATLTVTGDASINASVVEAALGNGSLSIEGDTDTVNIIINDAISSNANNALSLGGTGNQGSIQVNQDIDLDGSLSITTSGLTGEGGISLASGQLTVIQSGNTTFNGVISGTDAAFIKDGTGHLYLGGASTYTGSTTVNDGTLALAAANRLPDTTALTVNANGTFSLNGFNETVGSIAGSGLIVNGAVIREGLVMWLDAGNPASYDGSGNLWLDLTGNDYHATLLGEPAYNSDSGMLSFTNATQYAQLGTLPADFLGNPITGLTVFSIANFGTTRDKWERLVDFGNGPLSNNIVLARYDRDPNLGMAIYIGNASGARRGSPITDNVKMSFAGTADGSHWRMYSISSTNTISNWQADTDRLPLLVERTSNYIGKSNWSNDSAYLGEIGTVMVYNRALSQDDIELNHEVLFNRAEATLTMGGNNASTTFSGKIENGASTLNIVKTGMGTLTLSGQNGYTGSTEVEAGVVQLGASGSGSFSPLGTVAGATTIASGAALDLAGYTLATAEPITISGTGASGSGAIYNSSTTGVAWSGATTLAADASIKSAFGGALTWSGPISGWHALTIEALGDLDATITINGAVTLGGEIKISGNGDIIVDADVIADEANALTLKATNNINVNSGRTLQTQAGTITLWSDSDNSGSGGVALTDNSKILTSGGDIVIGGGTDPLVDGAKSRYAINLDGAHLEAGAGDISLYGQSRPSPDEGAGVRIVNSAKLSGKDIAIVGLGSTDNTARSNHGVKLEGGNTLISASGNLSITGTGGGRDRSRFNHGLFMRQATVETTGSGTLTITGTGGAPARGEDNDGIRLESGTIRTTTGTMTLIGVAGSGRICEGFAMTVPGPTTLGDASQSGDIIIQTDVTYFHPNSTNRFVGTGSLTIEPLSGEASFDGAFNLINLSLDANLSGLTIGKPGNVAAVNVRQAVSIGGPVSVYASTINVAGALNSSDEILLEAATGDLVVSAPIASTLDSGTSITLNAGKSESVGTASGGDIKMNDNGAVTVSGDANAKLFTGSPVTATGLADIADESLVFYDETSILPSLKAGKAYAIYRYTVADRLVLTTPPSTTGASGVPWATQPSVAITDAFGNVIRTQNDAIITAAIFSGEDGTLGGVAELQVTGGVASYQDLSVLGPVGNAYRIRFSSPGLYAVASEPLTLTAPGPVDLTVSQFSGDPIGNVKDDGESTSLLTVTLTDAFGNPRAGDTVVFELLEPEGRTLGASQGTTNAAGQFSTTLASTVIGITTVKAYINSISPANLIDTVGIGFIAGEPTQIELLSGDGQTGEVASALANPMRVRILDASDNPVEGAKVAFTGDGLTNPSNGLVLTDAQGEASIEWVLGEVAGAQTLVATLVNIEPAQAVTFQATAEPGPPAQWAFEIDTYKQLTTIPFDAALVLQDAYNNPTVANTPLTVTLTATNQSFIEGIADADDGTLSFNDISGPVSNTLPAGESRLNLADLVYDGLSAPEVELPDIELTASSTLDGQALTGKTKISAREIQLVVTASPNTIVADGVEQSVVTAVLSDIEGNPVPNQPMQFKNTLGQLLDDSTQQALGQPVVLIGDAKGETKLRFTSDTASSALVLVTSRGADPFELNIALTDPLDTQAMEALPVPGLNQYFVLLLSLLLVAIGLLATHQKRVLG